MDNRNGTGCSPYSSSSAVNGYDCFGTTGPYGSGFHNLTNPQNPAINQTGEQVMEAMKKCCPSDVEPWGDDGAGKPCYSYCKVSGLEEAAKANVCFDQYKTQFSAYFYGNLGCNLGDKPAADEPGSAATLGRTGGWGGLVVLGLVISTSATMF